MPHAKTTPEVPALTTEPVAPGCLVLVVGPEHAGPDLLITAARRRIADLGSLEFPKVVTTRRNGPRDAEVFLGRDVFHDIEREGGFLASWAIAGHRFGLPLSVRADLDAGRTVVVAVPASAVSDFQDTCAEVRVVRLTAGPDAARQTLTPQACFRRMMGPKLAQRLEGRRLQPQTDAVSCGGDVVAAIRGLTDVLARIDQERAQFPD